MGRFRYVIADVFTDTPLAGNPVAVFTDAREIREEQLQPLARELNLSETVFCYPPGSRGGAAQQAGPAGSSGQEDALEAGETDVVPRAAADAHARIRIFTPKVELPFAGHPTLGTAFILAGPLQLQEIRLETGAGTVPVRLEREGARIVFGRMEQPVPTWQPFAGESELLAALRVERSVLPVEVYSLGPHVYVALDDPAVLAGLAPDLGALEPLGVGVNCFAPEDGHWKLRMWAPAFGVSEDPATGSAAGPLAVHLARHGRTAFGEEIEISQGTEIRRPSTLFARADGERDRVERVEVGGAAIVVARGEFRLPA